MPDKDDFKSLSHKKARAQSPGPNIAQEPEDEVEGMSPEDLHSRLVELE